MRPGKSGLTFTGKISSLQTSLADLLVRNQHCVNIMAGTITNRPSSSHCTGSASRR